MPYIPKADRPRVAESGATNAGELNYELTLAIRAYLRENAPLKYEHINHVVGCLTLISRLRESEVTFIGPGLERALYSICDAHRGRRGGDQIVGALECCKLEFYRRVAVPYEDNKWVTNGDVY